MGFGENFNSSFAQLARTRIINDYINEFNEDLNSEFSIALDNFITTYSNFASNAATIVKFGHSLLGNLELNIRGTVIPLPQIQIPLTVSVNDSTSRIDAVTSQAYAENIRIALAAIQYFYTIDVTQYQEGAQSLLGGFTSNVINLGPGSSFNFFENVLNSDFSNAATNSANLNGVGVISSYRLDGISG